MLPQNDSAPHNNMNSAISSESIALKNAPDASYLSDQISSQRVEQTGEETSEELTVYEAARLRGRSPRQIRRLLQSGHLAGYKIMGANGPEWRVFRSQSVLATSNDFSAMQQSSDGQPEDSNDSLANISDRIENIMKKMDLFESAMKRVDKLAGTLEQLQAEVERLNEMNKRNELIVNELHNLKGHQSTIEYVESEVRHHKECLDELAAARSKSSWWKRAFTS